MDVVHSTVKWIRVRVNNGKPYIGISFNNPAIQYIDIKAKTKKTRSCDNITIANIDTYTNTKFANALKYLISKIKFEKKYNSIDEDPFSPSNFNPNSLGIQSKNNTGTVSLIKKNGVFNIPILIGGVSKEFVFDTGASDVLISKKLEQKLITKGYLKKEYYLTDGLYRIADGSIIRLRRLLIPELTIGDFTLFNVEASVTNGDTLLLGKSVLDKFKNWNINNLTQTLELKK